VPVNYGGKRAYICIRCYRSGVRLNPLSGYVDPSMVYQNLGRNVVAIASKQDIDIADIFASKIDEYENKPTTKNQRKRLLQRYKEMTSICGDPFYVSSVARKKMAEDGLIV